MPVRLLPGGQGAADRFGLALDRLDAHLQARQLLQQGRAGGLLQRFQVEHPSLAAGRGDHPQEASELKGDLVLDRARRFF